MASDINRLNARKVSALKTSGRYADGGNLYLSVSESGAKSWAFLFRWRGTQREIGIGSARDEHVADPPSRLMHGSKTRRTLIALSGYARNPKTALTPLASTNAVRR
jgi:hypothetical protein